MRHASQDDSVMSRAAATGGMNPFSPHSMSMITGQDCGTPQDGARVVDENGGLFRSYTKNEDSDYFNHNFVSSSTVVPKLSLLKIGGGAKRDRRRA